MNEKLIKPYEISVWEDELIRMNGSYQFTETKVAIIGSNTMTGLNKIYDPVFHKKSNGEKTLSFSLKYKYFDPLNENEEVINPFASLLVNERKIKLFYDEEWYEFIVKEHSESSEDFTWSYTCVDAFVHELSKNGYNIEFDTELENNLGTAQELAEKTLENTEWTVGKSEPLKQFIEEPIYNAVLESTAGISILNVDEDREETLDSGTEIYLFYNYVANKSGKFVQFIIKDENKRYTIDNKNVITAPNYRIKNELIFKENGFYLLENPEILVITWDNIDTFFQANRLAYNQVATYDPMTKRIVDCYTFGDGREVYKYTDNIYTTSGVVTNFISNGDSFNIVEKRGLEGWSAYVNSENNSSIKELSAVTYPELKRGKELVNIEELTLVESFMKVDFVGALTNNYLNPIFNDGINDNINFIESIANGDEFVFRWRAGYGELDNLSPANVLGLLIAKYSRSASEDNDTPYYYIDPDNVILNIKPSTENQPIEFNNIIEGGDIREIEGHQRYVIDNVVQTISTKYLYKNGIDGLLYYWDKKREQFTEKEDDSSYLPYYYLTGKATKAISNADLTDNSAPYGIFIYTTSDNIKSIYVQDIQLTRYIPDDNGQPVLIGNVPVATSIPTDYYYLKPSKNMTEEDIQMYLTLEDLQESIGTSDEIKPVYNEQAEKKLSISVSKSNCFNILQTIGETFECWIDLVVPHDERGYIICVDGRPIKEVYLREYIGKDNFAGFKYGINLKSIERTIDSNEIVTKLIVDQAQSDYVDEGYMSIANAPSNQSGESYILNFEYYYNQGLLNREIAEKDRINFIEAVKQINLNIKAKEEERANLQKALLKLDGDRRVFTELLNKSQDELIHSENKFYDLAHDTYESYRITYNNSIGTDEEEKKSIFEEENILETLGSLYTSASTINNYSGILSNIETECEVLRKKIYGSASYSVRIWSAQDNLRQTHVYIELNDYLPGLQFFVGEGDSNYQESTISRKYFDITINPDYSKVGTLEVGKDIVAYADEDGEITLKTPQGFFFKIAEDTLKSTYSYSIGKPITLKIVTEESIIGIEDEIEELLAEKKRLVNSFNNKYNRFISEGTWSSTDYIDSELYYLDALQVSNTSAQPAASYTINVVEVSQLEGLELYSFDAGDKTYIEDTEFFGWANINVGTEEEPKFILTPAREEVIVSEVEWHLDSPEENVITVQNYKTRFEDLFQRINATVQTVQYNEATYAKMSTLLDANGTINENVLLDSLQRIAGKKYELTSDGSVLIDGDCILVQNLTETNKRVIITSEGIKVSSDGGRNWATAIDGHGINIGTVYTGKLNTDQVIIGSDANPSFRWDKSGISAYKSDAEVFVKTEDIAVDSEKTYYIYDSITGQYSEVEEPTSENIETYYEKQTGYDLKTFVRYDQYGLYGIKDNGTFLAQSLEDVKDKAHFAVTWDGFFIKNSYEGGGRVEITSDNDFRVLNDPLQQGNFQEKIKIGALEWGEGITSPDAAGATALPTLYGIRIKNDAGDTVMKTGDNGNLEVTGAINATEGNFSGLINVGPQERNHIIIDGRENSISPSIRSANYQDGAGTGWMVDKNGDAYFNNITARGAIKTAVFEYAEIQAVGGIFIFRPSSTIKTAEVVGSNLKVTVEKPALFKAGQWCKVSNYTDSGEATDPDVTNILLNNGLTHVYQVFRTQSTNDIILLGAAAMVEGQDAVTTCEKLVGGALVDMGNKANGDGVVGTSNYGIGINSSDNTINLPARAISLFETVVDETHEPKVTYNYRGILGTLPVMNSGVNADIYRHMQGTQGIYTDNMYIGDNNQFVAFYEDGNGDKQLKIQASQIVFEVTDDHGQSQWHDVAEIEAEGVPGPAGQDAIQVVIDSSAGDIFKNREISSVLTCTVYAGTRDITNQVTSFTWQKKNSDGTIDTSWSRLTAGRSITIGPNDINSKAIFICTVEF